MFLLPNLVTSTRAATEQVVYSFQNNGADGNNPYANLIAINGTLYGTTVYGGAYGAGTVFSITRGGTEKVIYSFQNNDADGINPWASLIHVNGTFYGTTLEGGSHGSGAVFSITKDGTEKVIHSFQGGGADGAYPAASLLDVNGTMYGTTVNGGSGSCNSGCGTVFSITPDGTESVLYSFQKNDVGDGNNPWAGLIYVNGTFYGTTMFGGAYGNGTVFSITSGGSEIVLHSFDPLNGDALNPNAGLISVGGKLYGTAADGGRHGPGAVYSITPGGNESVIYSFKGGVDGINPSASLIDIKGTLFGTTAAGGPYDIGTVFSVTKAGKKTLLYSFQGNGTDGATPKAGLIDVKGTLYGTTSNGGTNGAGAVFSIVR